MPGTIPGLEFKRNLSGSPEVEMASVSPDTCIAVQVEHQIGGIPKKSKYVYIQFALLYTSPLGYRRLRVSTLALRCASSPTEVYRSVDFGTYTAVLTRNAAANVYDPKEDVLTPLRTVRRELLSKVVKTLVGYRKGTDASNLPTGQLVLPDRLQLLPLFCMSLLKSVLLRPSLPSRSSGIRRDRANPTADERAYALLYGSQVTPATAFLMAHPNIFPLLQLEGDEGEWVVPQLPRNLKSVYEQVAHHAHIQMPKPFQPSISFVRENGAYLVDDGLTLYILVGEEVSSEIREQLLSKIEGKGCFLNAHSEIGKKAQRIVWQCRTFSAIGEGSETLVRRNFAPCVVVFSHGSHKDPFDETVMNLMVDDTINGERDYLDFLCELHKKIKWALEN